MDCHRSRRGALVEEAKRFGLRHRKDARATLLLVDTKELSHRPSIFQGLEGGVSPRWRVEAERQGIVVLVIQITATQPCGATLLSQNYLPRRL